MASPIFLPGGQALGLAPHNCTIPSVAGPKFEIQYWHALFAPAAAPGAVIEKLNGALQALLDDPATVKGWMASGVLPYAKDERSTQAARALFKSEIMRWGEVIRENKIQAPD